MRLETLGDFVVPFVQTAAALVVVAVILGVLLMIVGMRSLRSDAPPAAPRRALEPQLQPGDCLLYSPKGLFGLLISIKTWHAVAHCEGYLGDGQSVASRDGIGVDQYPLRQPQLRYVLRPSTPFNLEAAQEKFESTWRGQGYDYLGLLRFGWRAPVRDRRLDNRQFCSEMLTRWYRAGGLDPFNSEDADAVPPFLFLTSNCYTVHVVRPDGTIAPRALESTR